MSSASAIENVLKKVTEEARRESLASLDDGLRQALEVLGSSEKEASEEISRAIEEIDHQAETLKRRVIGGAELSARNRSLQLVEVAINRAFEEALRRLREEAPSGRHKEALLRFLREGIDVMGVKEVLVSANARDLALLAEISPRASEEIGVKIIVSPNPIDCASGVKLRTADGSMIYTNTVEARLERVKPLLKRRIAELISRGG